MPNWTKNELLIWGPPLPIINQMKKMFKDYDIYISGCYIGEGYEFAGVYDDE